MMVENVAGLAVIVGAAFYARNSKLQMLMIAKYILVIMVNNLFSEIHYTPMFESYYLCLSTAIAIPACVCITLIMTRAAYIYAIVLSAQAIVSALVIIDMSAVYLMYDAINVNIIAVEISLAWYAAVKSRMG